MPILHGISRDHYAIHAAQLLLTGRVYPMLMSSVSRAWGTLDRKSSLFKFVAKFFLKGVVLIFWHDIVYIELLHCVTKFELVWTWIEAAVIENAKKHRLNPTFPYSTFSVQNLTAPGVKQKNVRSTIISFLHYFIISEKMQIWFNYGRTVASRATDPGIQRVKLQKFHFNIIL